MHILTCVVPCSIIELSNLNKYKKSCNIDHNFTLIYDDLRCIEYVKISILGRAILKLARIRVGYIYFSFLLPSGNGTVLIGSNFSCVNL